MRKPNIYKLVVITAIFVVVFGMSTPTLSSAISPNSNSSNSNIAVTVSNSVGNPLGNVSIQGLMQLSPDNGQGYTTVFTGISNHAGTFTVKNKTKMMRIARNWNFYKSTHSTAFSPYILVFLTYKDNGSIYTQQTSIRLTPAQLVGGGSYHAFAHMTFTKKHKLTVEKGIGHPSSPTVTPSDITNPIPTEMVDGIYYFWIETNSSQITNNGGYLLIPLATAQASGSAWVESGEAMTATSTDYTGTIVNPYSLSSVQIEMGASNGQNSNSYSIGPIWQSTHVSNGYNYAYIEGYLTVANFELYYSTYGYAIAENSYQTLIGITDVATSGSAIQGNINTGAPAYQSEVSSNFEFQPISNSNPINTGGYSVTDATIYSSNSNNGEMAGILIAVGAIVLAAVTAGTAAVVAGIVVGALGVTDALIGWGSSSQGSILGGVEYGTTNGATPQAYVAYSYVPFTEGSSLISFPTMNVYVYGQPTSSSGGGGGGGCVLNGTEISLANGSTIPVQDLQAGMKTLSYNTVNGQLITSTVTKVTETNVTDIISINNEIYISGMSDQPVYVKLADGTTEWTVLGNINTTMSIFNALNNTWVPVKSYVLHEGSFSVFDVQTARQIVSSGHTEVFNDYIANSFLLDKKLA